MKTDYNLYGHALKDDQTKSNGQRNYGKQIEVNAQFESKRRIQGWAVVTPGGPSRQANCNSAITTPPYFAGITMDFMSYLVA